MNESLLKVYNGEHLSQDESFDIFCDIISGKVSPIHLASMLTSMKVRGESIAELTGAALASLKHAEKFPSPDYMFADIVGTGGDGAKSINISTASSFVAAACGYPIAKHGNRSVSSLSGSSDVLTELGVNIYATPEKSRALLDELGVCFLFAQQYHQGFKNVAPIRAELKTRTIFNVLGPLINPARPRISIVGVYNESLVRPMAEVLKNLGYANAAVIHTAGMDEVSLHADTHVAELADGCIEEYRLTAKDFGLPIMTIDDIRGGTPAENKILLENILQGKGEAAHENVVAANVALLMRLFGKRDVKQNVEEVLSVIRTAKPYEVLQKMVKGSQA